MKSWLTFQGLWSRFGANRDDDDDDQPHLERFCLKSFSGLRDICIQHSKQTMEKQPLDAG